MTNQLVSFSSSSRKYSRFFCDTRIDATQQNVVSKLNCNLKWTFQNEIIEQKDF